MEVYLKNLRKTWLSSVIPPIFLFGFVVMMAMGWVSLKEVIKDRIAQISNPMYQAVLGNLSIERLGLTWQAAAFMYTIGMMNILLLFIALYPTRLLYQEIDKRNLDVILSYPIPRWKYLLEKFSGFLTYSLLYPLCIFSVILISSYSLQENIDVILVLNYSIGTYFQIFALGSISLLCVSIFLESNKSMTIAGAIVLCMYLLESMGGFIQILNNIQFLSIFHYFKIDTFLTNGFIPLSDLIIVIGIGCLALFSSLVIFERREFAI